MISLGFRDYYHSHYTESETAGQSNLLRSTQLGRISARILTQIYVTLKPITILLLEWGEEKNWIYLSNIWEQDGYFVMEKGTIEEDISILNI